MASRLGRRFKPRRLINSEGTIRENGTGTTSDSTIFSQVVRDNVKPTHLLDQAIESFGYDPVQNEIFTKETAVNATDMKQHIITALRYFILFFIGLCTGLAATLIDYLIAVISKLKYSTVSKLISEYDSSWGMVIPALVWSSINILLTGIASLLVVFFAPVAAGSGISQVKCYLNGLNIPLLLRFVTMLVKGLGVVCAVAGGLAVGKEGPMIHIGAVIAGGLSQGRFRICKHSIYGLRHFRNDREKRDFVSAGAAAGVAAAFGAPVGGLLFALEEGASFVYQKLTWNLLFASMVSMFSLAFMKSVIKFGTPDFTPGGLISFGTFDSLDHYTLYEILIFIIMGVFGGLTGALFVKANSRLTRYRQRYVKTKCFKVMETMLVTFLSTSVSFTLMWAVRDCSPVAYTTTTKPLKLMCADNEFNSMSSLAFATPESSLHTLLHDPVSSFSITSLVVFFLAYFPLACVTYGLSVPSGLFIPGLLVGAAWGRVVGTILHSAFPRSFPSPTNFALIGAAAQLGGIIRMTLSLTVILMEATGSVIVGLPLLATLTVAKYVGDYLSEGIYDEHIELSGLALLPWQSEPFSATKRAHHVMSSPVVYLDPVMRVGDLVSRIRETSSIHHGFPVVAGPVNPARYSYGSLIGLLSTEHLGILLQHRAFLNEDGTQKGAVTFRQFDDAYPSYTKLTTVLTQLTEEDMDEIIDFQPYMCRAPYSVPETMTMTRVYNLFRLLGLRHLPVVDSTNQLRGIITRKDLRRFRFESFGDEVHIEEMEFSRNL